VVVLATYVDDDLTLDVLAREGHSWVATELS